MVKVRCFSYSHGIGQHVYGSGRTINMQQGMSITSRPAWFCPRAEPYVECSPIMLIFKLFTQLVISQYMGMVFIYFCMHSSLEL